MDRFVHRKNSKLLSFLRRITNHFLYIALQNYKMVMFSEYFTGRPLAPSEQAALVARSRAAAARQERARARRRHGRPLEGARVSPVPRPEVLDGGTPPHACQGKVFPQPWEDAPGCKGEAESPGLVCYVDGVGDEGVEAPLSAEVLVATVLMNLWRFF